MSVYEDIKTGISDDMRNIIKAIDKQIPKKVKTEIHFTIHPYFHFFDVYRCPNCNNLVKEYEDSWTYPKNRNNYCNKCGQALDWE